MADAVSAQARERIDRTHVASMVTELLGANDPSLIQDIVDNVEWRRLEAGDVLFHEGDASDAAYFIVGGRLMVSTRIVAPARIERIGELGRGDVVGELGLLDDAPRSATVRAVRDSTLATLRSATFEQLVMKSPALMLHVARGVISRSAGAAAAGRHGLVDHDRRDGAGRRRRTVGIDRCRDRPVRFGSPPLERPGRPLPQPGRHLPGRRRERRRATAHRVHARGGCRQRPRGAAGRPDVSGLDPACACARPIVCCWSSRPGPTRRSGRTSPSLLDVLERSSPRAADAGRGPPRRNRPPEEHGATARRFRGRRGRPPASGFGRSTWSGSPDWPAGMASGWS